MPTESKDFFLKHPKADAHNHLNLGMRYSSYAKWAGFFIPNFPRPLKGLPEMHEIISEYTRPRCQTADDVRSLIEMSISDAIKDGVMVLEGSIDMNFIMQYKEDIDALLTMVSDLVSLNKKRIFFRPELGIGKTADLQILRKWVPICISSGVFKSIDLYGPEVEDGIHNFKGFFMQAAQYGLKRKAHVGEFSNARSVKRFVEFFNLDQVQHGIGAVQDEKVLQFLADNHIQLNVCPESNIKLGAVPSLKKHPIRALIDAGISLTVATDDLLFFDRTVSEQIYDLVQNKVITTDEAITIMNTGLDV